MKKILLIFIFANCLFKCFSQGGIDNIKNQPCMKHADRINCNDTDGDNLSQVICSNLKYQKSDSFLVAVYNKLLEVEETDSARNYIIQLQKEWRALRDKHCKILWDRYKGGLGHSKKIIYLECLTELTDDRRKEWKVFWKWDIKFKAIAKSNQVFDERAENHSDYYVSLFQY